MFYAKPYVTYIPFDYQFKAFYFQATWQNDCIYRAKNASVAWVGLHDIDEYWQALAGVSYDLTESCAIAVAYRAFATDYQDGSFLYDTTTSGPNIGLVFRF